MFRESAVLRSPRYRVLVDVFGAAVFVVFAVDSARMEGQTGGLGVTRDLGVDTVILVLAMTVPLAVRRQFPRSVAVVTSAAAAVAVAAGHPIGIGPLGAVLALFSLAYLTPVRSTVGVGLPACLALSGSLIWTTGISYLTVTVGNTILIPLAVVAGALLRLRGEQREMLLAQNRELEAARAAHIRSAVKEERLRIAREVHDAVGHSLVGITLQARAAGKRIEHDPARAAASLEEIESLAQSALDETRLAVSTIRQGAAPTGPSLQLNEASLSVLVQAMSGPDHHIDLFVTGSMAALDPEVERAALRILQESLSNVVRHAGPARASVVVHVDDEAVRIEVTNNGDCDAAAAPGSGLVGMTERAELLGGHLEAGPTADGWRVHARLPRHLSPRTGII
ncbi:sensor histidine kinase [Natronoglycomyces albus]|uniref:histidine kinase n=1 Tax=Natronoglycomyces albus TaxID=2811108 RepID=A0A895XJQ2_9ACTN|nr:sensor histidine kinase [Natronoglycomyces albus]QSB05237.1 sensor histidine kinase [Natronoglycomyces albus]